MASPRQRSFIWRLAVTLIIVQSATIVFVAWLAVARIRSLHAEQATAGLVQLASALGETARTLSDDGHTALDGWLVRTADSSGLQMTLLTADGAVLSSSPEVVRRAEDLRTRPEMIEAIDGGTGSAARPDPVSGQRMIFAAVRLELGGGKWGVLRVGHTMGSLNSALLQKTRAIVGAAALMIAVGVSAVVLFTNRISTMILRLARSAERFAGGELKHRLLEPPGQEFALLTDSINRMADQLSEKIDQLEQQRNELDAILRSMESAVIALDPQHQVIQLNRAAEILLGVRDQEARGRLLVAVMNQPMLARFIDDAFSRGERHTDMFVLESKQPIDVRATSRALRDAQGRRTGLLIVLSDITRLRRLEDMRTDFAANVSHELRTPITNVKGYVETLQEFGFEDATRARQFLDVIARNTKRLGAIVDDILALTRLEQPDSADTLQRRPVPARQLLGTVRASLEGFAREREIGLQVECAEELVLEVNEALLEQAVGNLVDNAIKYSSSGTRVLLRAGVREESEGRQMATIEVIDHGPGIAAKHLDRLFERFYRVDKARSREMGGTGLGLAIVKHIALVHGGRAEAESTPGKGSTFRLVLPLSRSWDSTESAQGR